MLRLEPIDEALLAGEFGKATAHAMKLLTRYGEALGAGGFVDITCAHIDGCLYHGQTSLDFAQRFVDLGGRVRVPTTLNVGAVDAVHRDWNHGPAAVYSAQTKLNDLHVALGCRPTLTCAPYQALVRPKLGEHVAWAESNAIVFANSVLGARTDRYGDFTDLCAALTGRVPLAGLHCEENRVPRLLLDVVPLDESGQPRDLYLATVGYVLGQRAGSRVALLAGLPADTNEDELKSVGASAASSGSVGMFHALHVTPEARDWDEAHVRTTVDATQRVDRAALEDAMGRLCRLEPGEPVSSMCLGTPHYSFREFEHLARVLAGRRPAPNVDTYVSTSRAIAAEVTKSAFCAHLETFGVKIVVDTCTYVASIVRPAPGAIVTTSAKYAHYAPGNLRRRCGLMTLERCVRSAELGAVAGP